MTPKDSSKATCWNCVFGERLTPGVECRRYPPTVHIDARGDEKKVRPRMFDREWCGEFKLLEIQE
jgi:hypothetical protein